MVKKAVIVALAVLLAGLQLAAQQKKAVGTKSVIHDLTVTTPEQVYTGTMDLTVEAEKVTGKMVIASPTAITGNVAGTAKSGVLTLDFPYHMAERNCDGTVKMTVTLPEKLGPAKGTMEATGCNQDGSKTTGTVELKPSAAQPAGKSGKD